MAQPMKTFRSLPIVSENHLGFWKEAALIVGASLTLGLLGKLMIPLPFTPIPLALRSQIVLLMAVLLGPRRAFLAVAGFLAQGVAGLPVFTHGAAGFGALVGANGGYLFGYLAAALAAGHLAKRHILSAQVVGMAVIYLFGFGYLATFVGVKSAWFMGVVPFLIVDAIKIAVNVQICRFFQKNRKSGAAS